MRAIDISRAAAEAEKSATGPTVPDKHVDPIAFPQSVMTGSMGDLAATMAEGTEVPEEFYFAAGLTILGSLCGSRLKVHANVESEPRLYTVLLAQSADAKKSTAQGRAIKVFMPLLIDKVEVLHGVGSAEGLARTLAEKTHVLLCYDELKALMDKASIEGSALLAITASMFENHRWSNATKDAKQSVRVDDGHLALLGCCTVETYGRMWTNEAISIGLPNRLFIVGADRKRKVAWPEEPNQFKLDCLVDRIRKQLATLPKKFSISNEAKRKWEAWYFSLPSSEHAKRLDTLGFRLMGLIAITHDKDFIDVETIDCLVTILGYELRIRQIYDPIDADNHIARLEEKIRRALAARGPLGRRDLLRYTNANRAGLWAFDQALSNIRRAGQVHFNNKSDVFTLVQRRWCYEASEFVVKSVVSAQTTSSLQ